jgi:uncharacterized protein YigA (DUF484 family)
MRFGKTRRSAERQEPTDTQVADYLGRHPDFFHRHLALLEILRVPHPCGEAVSLVARQIDLLRQRNHGLQAQFNELLRVARENDALFGRLHQLTLALLEANTLDDALAGLKWSLHEGFRADFVAVRIFRPVPRTAVGNLYLVPEPTLGVLLEPLLKTCEPTCGKPPQLLVEFLFGKDAPEVRSCALVPLCHAGLKGVLAIGGRSAERFRPDMGHLFLTRMGEIVAARLVALLDRET